MPTHSLELNYGGDRALPVHAAVEDPHADLDSGLLIQVHLALLRMRDGQILRVSSPNPDVTEQLRSFEAASAHGILSVSSDPDRPGWTDHYLRKGRARTDWAETDGGAEALAGPSAAPQSVERLMPTRLWVYTNYDCNLACDYCCVVSGPRADPRRLSVNRIHVRVDEAVTAELDQVFLTGGEPTLRPDLPELIEYVTDRLPLTLLTNAMLLRGPRWANLMPLIERVGRSPSRSALIPRPPDVMTRTAARVRTPARWSDPDLVKAGARVRLAASLPEAALDELPGLHRLADTFGIAPKDRIFRPIALRGAASEVRRSAHRTSRRNSPATRRAGSGTSSRTIPTCAWIAS